MRGFALLLALILTLSPFPINAPPMVADVVVWGGTPEGVAAAVAAARAGASVILAVDGRRLGGVLVEGELNTLDQSVDVKGRILNEGIYLEWFRQLEAESFNPATAERAFRSLVARELQAGRGSAGTLPVAESESTPRARPWLLSAAGPPAVGSLQVLWNVRLGEPIVKEDRLTAVPINRGAWAGRLVGARWIDASEDADLAASAGVPFTVGWESAGGGRTGQAASLVFRVEGVDWAAARASVDQDGNPATGSTNYSLWGFPQAADYQPRNPNLRLRALNIGRVGDDLLLINGLLIFGVDPLDPVSRQRGMVAARAELPRIVSYLRRVCPGFRSARLVGSARSLYIRESRHLADPLYLLTLDDVNHNRWQPDVMGWGSYPVDVQPRFPGEPVRILGRPSGYAIPLRSLLTHSLNNLAIASRSAGYTPQAHGSARTVPVGMAGAQGAGVAAAISLQRGVSLTTLAEDPILISFVQRALRVQGVRLEEPPERK